MSNSVVDMLMNLPTHTLLGERLSPKAAGVKSLRSKWPQPAWLTLCGPMFKLKKSQIDSLSSHPQNGLRMLTKLSLLDHGMSLTERPCSHSQR